MAGKDHIKASFDQIYELGNFSKNILLEIFGANRADIFKSEFQKDESNNLAATEKKVIQKVLHYGNLTLDDTATLKLYEITLQSKVRIEQSKVGIQQYIRKNLLSGEGALVNFINPDDKNTWRLTLVASDAVLTDKGITNKKLNAKRYTFIVGASEQNKTISDRFAELEKASKIVLYPSENEKNAVSLVNTFSVEKLSTSFFDEYTLHYKKFVEYLENSNFRKSVFSIDYPEKATQKEIDNANKPIRDFAKKMLGRIVFLYFVQKKGWLGATNTDYIDGKDNFIFNLFKDSGANENFYHNWLSKLFFETLNKQRIDDVFLMPDNTCVKIPYLNGGLFDPEEYDNKLLTFPPALFHSDDFEDRPLIRNLFNTTAHRGFLDFLNSFNFTVHEDSPEDHTVAVDPEMLGHIFENLLEDNKDKGTFYTPKEIVHYMCQESLIEYLNTHLNPQSKSDAKDENGVSIYKKQNTNLILNANQYYEEDYADIQDFVKNKTVNEYILNRATNVNKYLDNVKICDPAIGSGAFPMGLLQEIFAIKELIAFETNSNWEPAKVKENIIQNSIYGVDIEKGAVDIARLRFWLSLIVNEEKPKALPNLDYKIVVGDSLLSKFEDEIIEINWDKTGSVGKADEYVKNVQRLLKEVAKKQKDYFNEEGNAKKILAAEIRNLKIDLLINQLSFNKESYANKNSVKIDNGLGLSAKDIKNNNLILNKIYNFDATIKKLTAIRNDASKPFNHFDWKLDFPEVLNPLLANQNHEEVEIVNHQINSLNHQIEAINSYLKKNNFDELLLTLQANVAQEQAIIIKEQLYRIENKIAEIYGNIQSVGKNIVSEPNESILYTINALNKNIEDINHKIESINDKVNFGNEIGFDIVIGNPPYIKEYTNKSAFDGFKNSVYYQGKMDLWYGFSCIMIDNLKENGIQSFIAQNNWTTSAGASKLRFKILTDTEIKSFVDFRNYKVFKTAGIQTMIYVLQKKKNEKPYSLKYSTLTDDKISQSKLNDFLNFDLQNEFAQKYIFEVNDNMISEKSFAFNTNDDELVLSQILNHSNFKLSEKEVAQGIVFPQDFLNKSNLKILGEDYYQNEGIFAITNDELNDLGLSKNEEKLIKPYFGTENFKRYYSNSKNSNWLIYTDSSFKNPENIKPYPNIKKHLDRFKNIITSDNKPYGLHRAREERFFLGEKIIVQRKCPDRPVFTYTDFDSYVSATFYVIKPFSLNQKYLTALLNSRLIAFWLRNKGSMQGNNFQLDKAPLLNIPLYVPSDVTKFIILVDYLLFLNQDSNINKLFPAYFEQIIDGMVYELYFPELLKQHNRNIIEHLGELPAFTESMSDNQKMEIINTVFNRLNEKNHPVKINLEKMKEIEEIKIIEGIKE